MKLAKTISICRAGQLTKAQKTEAIALGKRLVPNDVPELLNLVALQDGKVIGVLYADAKAAPAVIHVIGVHPAKQRLGIGKQLVAEFEKQMDFLGIAEFEVDCTTEASQKLFESSGFVFNGKHGAKPAWEIANNVERL